MKGMCTFLEKFFKTFTSGHISGESHDGTDVNHIQHLKDGEFSHQDEKPWKILIISEAM